MGVREPGGGAASGAAGLGGGGSGRTGSSCAGDQTRGHESADDSSPGTPRRGDCSEAAGGGPHAPAAGGAFQSLLRLSVHSLLHIMLLGCAPDREPQTDQSSAGVHSAQTAAAGAEAAEQKVR